MSTGLETKPAARNGTSRVAVPSAHAYPERRTLPIQTVLALADQVGNRPVGLAGTTGSARELVGAYLGTEHVYNEISAHARGAAHFDPEVDTIFEIGGQDSKYIYLRNGVPIDYAMNNACSAGTSSRYKHVEQQRERAEHMAVNESPFL